MTEPDAGASRAMDPLSSIPADMWKEAGYFRAFGRSGNGQPVRR